MTTAAEKPKFGDGGYVIDPEGDIRPLDDWDGSMPPKDHETEEAAREIAQSDEQSRIENNIDIAVEKIRRWQLERAQGDEEKKSLLMDSFVEEDQQIGRIRWPNKSE
jgi:hypothetical protein